MTELITCVEGGISGLQAAMGGGFWDKVNKLTNKIDSLGECVSDITIAGMRALLDKDVKINMASQGVSAALTIGGLAAPPLGLLISGYGILMSAMVDRGLDKSLDRIDKMIDKAVEEQCDEPPDPPGPRGPGGGARPVWIHDPSGVIYEVAMYEPIKGATATLLFETGSDTGVGTGDWNFFDMEWYGQVNPYITDIDGWYEWDVPKGNWMVMYEKEGYTTEYSEAMEVPPIRLDVHQALEYQGPSLPVGAYWTDEPDSIEIVFDRYVKTSYINTANISVYTEALAYDGTPLGGFEFLDGVFVPIDTVLYKGESVAKSFVFKLDEGEFTQGAAVYNVGFMPAIASYADIPLGFGDNGEKTVLDVTAPPPVKVKGITADEGWYILDKGETAQIVTEIVPAKAENKIVKWETSDASIATVSQNGIITAVDYGVCYITVTTDDGGFEACVIVYVAKSSAQVGDKAVTGVTLYPATLTLVEGGAPFKLTATVLPSDAANKAVTWSVCNPAIITVDQIGNVTPVGVGTCVVTVTTEGGGFTATCLVTVIGKDDYVPVTGVALDKSELNLTVGGASAQLTAAVSPDNASIKAVAWSVCNPAVVTVAQTGLVTPVGEGTCYITVTTQDGGFTATCKVVVTKQSSSNGSPGGNKPGETVTDPTPPLAWLNPYSDVTDTDWFFDAVKNLTEIGLMNGTGNGKFSPNVTMTRAMIVTILYRLEGKPEVTGDMPFKDVKSGQWYTDAILWASQDDIVLGYGNGKFGPDDFVTREQAVAILYRYAKAKGEDVSAAADLSVFVDADKISGWALDAIKWAVTAGIIEGRPGNLAAPQDTSTRAEIAMIFTRYIEGF
jgi:uncharacterized protein YjdB